MSERGRLLELLLERSFRVGDFVLSSGLRSRYYVDCRTTTTHAEGQALIGRLGLATLREAGLAPDVEADPHTPDGLVAALVEDAAQER